MLDRSKTRKVVSVRMVAELWRRLATVASGKGTTRSRLVEDMVRELVEKEQVIDLTSDGFAVKVGKI